MKDVEVLEERTLLPGLTFGCSQSEETRFVPWEKRERKGALKAMFSWKQHSVNLKDNNIKETTKEESDSSSVKEGNSTKDSSKKSTVMWNCEEDIDQNIYRVLTRGGCGRRSKGKRKKVSQDERWKGCKEQPSEIPVPRKAKKKQVTFSHHTLSILL